MATSTLGWWRKFKRLYSVAQSRFGHRDNLLKVAFLWTSLTRRLMKNNPWFEKILRHFQKIIWHFQKTIRHFQKTIRRLKRSKYSLTQHDQQGYGQQVHSASENRCEIIVEYFLFSRAYAYTQEFYLFCCHCCHSFLWISLFCNILRTSFGHLLIDKRSTSQNRPIATTRNTLFALSSYCFPPSFSPPFLSLCDTCDSKKTKLLLGCARGCTRYAQAREHQHFLLTSSLLFSARFFRVDFSS